MRKFWDWVFRDVRARIARLHESLDTLEERFVNMRADVFRKRTGR